MRLLKLIEYCLDRLLYRRRGYDADCLFNSKAFKNHANPTMPLTTPDCGASGGRLSDEYSAFGTGRIPTLAWPAASPNVKVSLMVRGYRLKELFGTAKLHLKKPDESVTV